MKKILFLIIFSLFVVNISSCGQTDTLPNDIGKKVSSPKGLKKIIDSQDSKFVIVDVRSASEYYNGHIPTAINIPGGLISDTKNPPSKDKYIILYCNVGYMAEEAGEGMLANGYKHIFVWGGITDWPYKLETSK
jgi:rhodanese-related sulfurtransferase